MKKTALKEYIKTRRGRVELCLKKYPETRKNDKTLYLRVWELEGFRFPKDLIPLFYKSTDASSIRRIRQTFHTRGLYRPDDLTVAKRTLKAMETRNMFREFKNVESA